MQRLALFAKRPSLGRVKTRLVPPLEPREALELYRAFLADQLEFLRSFAGTCDLELWVDGPWEPDPHLDPAVDDLALRQQGRGNLGARMLRAFRSAERDGATSTVLLGADAPTLPASLVERAFAELEGGCPGVVAPADDGGYVLIGLRQPVAELFRAIPWGGPDVLRVTLERADAGGVELRRLPSWYDVDDPAGLARLGRDLARPAGATRAPSTARAVARLDLPGGPVV